MALTEGTANIVNASTLSASGIYITLGGASILDVSDLVTAGVGITLGSASLTDEDELSGTGINIVHGLSNLINLDIISCSGIVAALRFTILDHEGLPQGRYIRIRDLPGMEDESVFPVGSVLYINSSGEFSIITPTTDGDTLYFKNNQIVWSSYKFLELTNNSGVTIDKGQAVFISGNNEITLSKADSTSTATCFGIATEQITNTNSGNVAYGGVLELTTGEWDTVSGGSGGLSAGAEYWVSAATAGNITSTAPTSPGQQQTSIGYGISTIKLFIDPQRYIAL